MARQPNNKFNAGEDRSVGRVLLRNVIIAVSLFVIIAVAANLLLGIVTRHGRNKDVPNLMGSTVEQAERTASSSRLKIVVNDSLYMPAYPSGVILEQRPLPGKKKVKSGRKIYVAVNASRQRMVNIPYVAGFSLRQAKSNLLQSGLEIDRLEYVQDMANGYVISQKYRGAEISSGSTVKAPAGSRITLVVGKSSDYSEQVPNLVGMSLREAKNAIWEKGFNVGNIEYDGVLNIAEQEAAKVYIQYPAQGTYERIGGDISVRMNLE